MFQLIPFTTMRGSLAVLVVISMVNEGFYFVAAMRWCKKEVKAGSQKEIFLLFWMTNFPQVKNKRPGFYNNVWCDKFTIIPSDKDSSRPSHTKGRKIDNASVQKHVRWIFANFYLFI